MNVRKLWSPKLGEWVLGSAVVFGCIAPSGTLVRLVGGQDFASCAGSYEADCAGGSSCLLSGEMPHFCAFYSDPPPHPPGPGFAPVGNNPCVSPCTLPSGAAGAGHCSVGDSCYY